MVRIVSVEIDKVLAVAVVVELETMIVFVDSMIAVVAILAVAETVVVP